MPNDWVPYVVRKGDHLLKLSARHAFDADEVWNHPKNADLVKARKSGHILCPGDVMYLPPAEAQWLRVSLGQVNQYMATVPTVNVTVTLVCDGKPMAGEPCTILELPSVGTLMTGGDGTLSFAAPATLETATVEFSNTGFVQVLRIGHVDPSSTGSGARQRLQNLGYVVAEDIEGEVDDATLQAMLLCFQHVQGLPTTGELDDATRARLESEHGC